MSKSSKVTSRKRARGARGKRSLFQNLSERFWIGAIILGMLAIAAIALASMRPRAIADIPDVESFGNLPRGHSPLAQTYPQTPPAGGVHDPAWQNCGIYDQPIRNENAVHSMEHGAVWIAYQPDLSVEVVDQLRGLARGQGYALLSPYAGLPTPVVATAWGVQLRVENAADPRLSQFIVQYMRGPQTPEPGAVCVNGIGAPTRG